MFVLNISGSQAQDYYYEVDPIIESNSQWYGGLSKDYNIENTACRENHFANLICGNDLAGNHVIKDGRDKSGHSFHKAGVDVVFSAPKSLSILALHTGDNKLIIAHKESVETTLDYLDKEYVYVREYDGLNTYVQKTGAGIFATFMHSTSRENDPQLHTHAILLNHTITPKGHKAVWFDKVFTDQVLINDIYQSVLAKYVQDLGYQIDTNGSGKWEITGVEKEWIYNFSKRSKAIDKVEQDFKRKDAFQNANDLTIRNIAVLKSRAKKDSSQNEKKLKEQWEKEVPADRIIKSVEQGKKAPSIEKTSSPGEHLRRAYYSIHEHKVLFTKKDLIQSALNLSRGCYTLSDFEKTFYEMRLKEEILPVSEHVSGHGLVHRYFTSRDLKETEHAIIDQFKKGKNACDPMISAQKADKIISKNYDYFSDDQKKMIQFILTSKARMMLVQGSAGTGKTSALKVVRDIIENEKSGVEIIGLGYTGKASQELKNNAGIESRTISSFLNEPIYQSTSERLIICNDVSMLCSLQANELIDKINCENSRLVLIGDGKQLQALSDGKIFFDLQEMDVPYVEMVQVLRQKTEFIQKAVNHIKDFHTGKNSQGIDDMFDLLQKNGNLIENPINSSLLRSVADVYLSNENRDYNLIVTPSND
ncbi:MAG: relaxase domain-containing protein [Desulfobacula sp.]|nr:relaxase domain-containing protein [Desulfobacula sp.]